MQLLNHMNIRPVIQLAQEFLESGSSRARYLRDV